jgi:hypothetical protein
LGHELTAHPENERTVSVKVAFPSYPEVNHQAVALDPMSDTVGDAAVAKLKYDSPPCQMAIVQRVQAGQMML